MTKLVSDMEAGRHASMQAKLNEEKEIKVKVPVRLLLKLHYTKITESRLMGDLVTDALTQYFQNVPGDPSEAGTAGLGSETTSDGGEEASSTS